jgi:hypothetical protein
MIYTKIKNKLQDIKIKNEGEEKYESIRSAQELMDEIWILYKENNNAIIYDHRNMASLHIEKFFSYFLTFDKVRFLNVLSIHLVSLVLLLSS